MSTPIVVNVAQRYIPALHSHTPAYGIQDKGTTIVVHLSETVPKPFLDILESELQNHLKGLVLPPASRAHYIERVTRDLLHRFILTGDLRHDKVTQSWRWVGEPRR